jgi:hypothetical protein
VALGTCAMLLLGTIFLAWFGRRGVSGAALIPDLDEGLVLYLSGWRVAPAAGAVALVTAAIGVGHALAGLRGFRSPIPAPGALVALGGVVAAALIIDELTSPDPLTRLYTTPQPGIYLALFTAIACAGIGGALHLQQGHRVELSRLDAADLVAAIAGVALLGSMALGWYSISMSPSEPPVGSAGNVLTPPETLSPWVSHDWVAYPVTATAALAIVAWALPAFTPIVHRSGLRLGVALAGGLSAGLIAMRIGDPIIQSRVGYLFGDTSTGIYASLAAALAIGVGGLVATRLGDREALAGPGAKRRRPAEPARVRETRVPRPLVIAICLVLALAVASATLTPVLSIVEIVAMAIGYRFRHWWLVPVPGAIAWIVAAATTGSCPDYGGDCLEGIIYLVWLIMGAAVCLSVLAGVLARWRVDRSN